MQGLDDFDTIGDEWQVFPPILDSDLRILSYLPLPAHTPYRLLLLLLPYHTLTYTRLLTPRTTLRCMCRAPLANSSALYSPRGHSQ